MTTAMNNAAYDIADMLQTKIAEEFDGFLETVPKSFPVEILGGLSVQVQLKSFYGARVNRDKAYIVCDLYVSGSQSELMVCAFTSGQTRDVFICRSNAMPTTVPVDCDDYEAQRNKCAEKAIRHFCDSTGGIGWVKQKAG